MIKKFVSGALFKMLGKASNVAGADRQCVQEVGGSYRILKLLPGDAAMVVKENGQTLTIDSGSKIGELKPNEELMYMMALYVSNPEFVKVLHQLFDEAIDELNAKRVVSVEK